jgi:catecholate siderophore receptor
MAPIKSRKHAPSRFNHQVGVALAAMLLPAAAAQAQQTMSEVNVIGSADNAFKAERAASPKYTEKLVDTAQTVQVIKKELIEQQGAVTLSDALRNTPGVGAFFLGENGSTSTGDAIYMRGFDTSGSIYVDGIRDIGSVSRDVFNIEQVDVLKGPAGTDNGRSAPTGSVNLISKQPTMDNGVTGALTAGSGRQKRATADWNRVIDGGTGTAFRLNLMEQDSGNPARDRVSNKRWAVAPAIAFGLNGKTRVYLDVLHVKQDNIPDGGVPTVGLPGYSSPSADPAYSFIGKAPGVDPKNFYGSTLDHDNVKADMVTARIEHDFSSTLTLVNTARYGKTSQDYLLTSFTATLANLRTPSPDYNSWSLQRSNLNIKDQTNEIVTNQTTVTADFATGAVKHTVVTGLELTGEKQGTLGYAASGALPLTSLYHPDPNLPVNVRLARNGARSDGSTNTESVYAFDTLKFGNAWIVNGGLRLDRYNTSYSALTALTTATPTQPVGTLVPTKLDASDTLVNGKLSVLYKPTKDGSVYALVATSRLPPGGATFALSAAANSAANPKFDPQETVTTEVGTKWDFLKQKLSFSAAAYRTVVKNEVEQDPVDALYYQTGRKRVQGIELGVTGEVVKNWLVSAGYTRMDTKVEAGKVVTASGVNNLGYTPKQAFTAWTSYTLPRGVQIGGGARFVDKLWRGTDSAIGTPAYAGAYWVYDAMLSYEVSKNLALRLNVYNLADKAYIAGINKSGYRYAPGAPRSASLAANFAF